MTVEFVLNELSCGKGFISCYLEKGLSRECFNLRHRFGFWSKSYPQILGEREVNFFVSIGMLLDSGGWSVGSHAAFSFYLLPPTMDIA